MTYRTILILPVMVLLVPALICAKTNYKKWLQEEVVWIISQKEVSVFEGLQSDAEKGDFIAEFWKRRDPTPDTPRNEFKEEHYRRFEHALKNFQEGTPGWKTDRGRIYIIHGPPAKEQFRTSDSRMLDSRTDARGSRTPNTVIWTYHQNPNASYYRGEINLVFQPSAGISRQSFTLGESKTAQDKADDLNRQFGPAADQTWLEADVRYQLVAAGPPSLVNVRGVEMPTSGLGETARYLEDLLRSPGDVLEERLTLAVEREAAKKEIREAVAAQLSFGSLPLSMKSRDYMQPDGNYKLLIQMEIPSAELASQISSDTGAGSRLDLYCALVDQRGMVIDEFLDSVNLLPEVLEASDSGKLRYSNIFRAPPGQYTLKAAVRNSRSERLGFRESAVDLTERTSETFEVSELLVTNRVEPASNIPSGILQASDNSVVLGDARLQPHPTRVFGTQDTLVLYFQVLLPAGRELQETQLSVAMNFIAADSIVKRVEPRKIEQSNSAIPGVVNFATTVPLAEFPAGEYTLQVQVIDHTAKKFAIQRGTFTIQ